MTSTGVIGIPAGEKYIVCKYDVTYEEEPTSLAINGGKITSLMIEADGEIIAHYDNQWCVYPEGEVAEIAYYILLQNYN